MITVVAFVAVALIIARVVTVPASVGLALVVVGTAAADATTFGGLQRLGGGRERDGAGLGLVALELLQIFHDHR